MFARLLPYFLSPYFLWVLLSLPALGMFSALTGDDARAFHGLLHPTGEFAARFMTIFNDSHAIDDDVSHA